MKSIKSTCFELILPDIEDYPDVSDILRVFNLHLYWQHIGNMQLNLSTDVY